MAFSINGSTFNLDLDTILIWCLVGLVAGFLASRVALGHGLGLFGDIIVGIIGAFIGGFLANVFHINQCISLPDWRRRRCTRRRTQGFPI